MPGPPSPLNKKKPERWRCPDLGCKTRPPGRPLGRPEAPSLPAQRLWPPALPNRPSGPLTHRPPDFASLRDYQSKAFDLKTCDEHHRIRAWQHGSMAPPMAWALDWFQLGGGTSCGRLRSHQRIRHLINYGSPKFWSLYWTCVSESPEPTNQRCVVAENDVGPSTRREKRALWSASLAGFQSASNDRWLRKRSPKMFWNSSQFKLNHMRGGEKIIQLAHSQKFCYFVINLLKLWSQQFEARR